MSVNDPVFILKNFVQRETGPTISLQNHQGYLIPPSAHF